MSFPLEDATLSNDWYRRVVLTTDHLQLVLMRVPGGSKTWFEVHGGDQFLRVEGGTCQVALGEMIVPLVSGDSIVVPAGTLHSIQNPSDHSCRLYTIYTPPEHAPSTYQTTEDAVASGELSAYDSPDSLESGRGEGGDPPCARC